MRLLVAVSGGVDSVVLLDALSQTSHELIVAHFDHGIRHDSAADARFVAALAQKYGLPFYQKREELGQAASEADARARRYAFLFATAADQKAYLVTAHHQDDVIATIAINAKRGTRWRGLAVFGDRRITRPLVGLTKQQVRDYATKRQLEWVEDSTNTDEKYLRNRLNHHLHTSLSEEDAKQLLILWHHQSDLARTIDAATAQYQTISSRYFLSCCGDEVATEILQSKLKSSIGHGLTSRQLERMLLAIKVARAGTTHDIEQGWKLKLTTREFYILPPVKMLL